MRIAMESGSLTVDQVLDGKYQIESVLGRGGSGVVYRARHLALGTPRAIKVLHRELAENEDIVRRFRNEARLAEELRHPNLVRLYDLSFLADGSFYIVWELVEGETLASLLRKGALFSPDEVAHLIGQVADGMEAAHRRQILHRDISPDNLMICRDPQGGRTVKVLDFGLAKVVGNVTEGGYTTAGVYLGKIGYSSPEQVGLLDEREHLDPRTDVFSLAVVAYRMLVGKLPFRTPNIQTFLFDLTTAPEEQVRERFERPLPGPWRKALSRALRRNRNARTPSMGELKKDIEEARRKSAGVIAKGLERGRSEAWEKSEIPSETEERVAPSTPSRRIVRRGALLVLPVVALFAWMMARSPERTRSSPDRVTTPIAKDAGEAVATLDSSPTPPATETDRTKTAETARPAAGGARPGEPEASETTREATFIPPVDREPNQAAEPNASSQTEPAASETTPPESNAIPPVGEPPGILMVEAAPTVTIEVDGRSAGRGRLELELDPGLHEIVFIDDRGYRSRHGVNIAAGERLTLSPRPDVYGSLSVTADSWAEVGLDDGPMEQTPVLYRRVPVGRHQLIARREGFEEQLLEVIIEEGKTTNVRVEWKVKP